MIKDVYEYAIDSLKNECQVASTNDVVCLIEKVEQLLHQKRLFNTHDLNFLFKIARKLEIKRSLFTSYSQPDFLPTFNANVASVELLESLLCLYMIAFWQTNDYRFINTVFKVADYKLDKPCFDSFNEPMNQFIRLQKEQL